MSKKGSRRSKKSPKKEPKKGIPCPECKALLVMPEEQNPVGDMVPSPQFREKIFESGGMKVIEHYVHEPQEAPLQVDKEPEPGCIIERLSIKRRVVR